MRSVMVAVETAWVVVGCMYLCAPIIESNKLDRDSSQTVAIWVTQKIGLSEVKRRWAHREPLIWLIIPVASKVNNHLGREDTK